MFFNSVGLTVVRCALDEGVSTESGFALASHRSDRKRVNDLALGVRAARRWMTAGVDALGVKTG